MWWIPGPEGEVEILLQMTVKLLITLRVTGQQLRAKSSSLTNVQQTPQFVATELVEQTKKNMMTEGDVHVPDELGATMSCQNDVRFKFPPLNNSLMLLCVDDTLSYHDVAQINWWKSKEGIKVMQWDKLML